MNRSFFPGFAWSLPHVFKDPLGVCRFEQGDVIYNSEDGYKPWDEAVKLLKWSIQIKSPQRSSGSALGDDDPDVFGRNWFSTVVFELTHYENGIRKERISTTQGRLYSFLRTGDFSCLDAETDAPPVPLLVMEANRCLDELEHGILKGLCEGMEKPHTFLMAFDPCNPVSRDKLASIRRCLAHYEGIKEKTFTPHEMQLKNAHQFVPTVAFCAFVVDTSATEKMRDCLKKVLYKPNKNNKTGADRFQLRRHGLFIPHKQRGEAYGIVSISFAHGKGHFYRFRYDTTKNTPENVFQFFKDLLDGDCPPNDIFQCPPTSSGLKLSLNDQITRDRNHPIIDLAGKSYAFEKYKSRHENLQVYFLENDKESIATEVPLWLAAEEFPNYKALFPEGGVLTGHIDLLRYEKDGKLWIWDFKPGAFEEKYAAGQVYSYAVMLAIRTGFNLEHLRCGYFDGSDAYTFEPAKIRLPAFQGGLL